MTKVLVLGASGQIARHVIAELAGDATIQMTLFLRQAARLANPPANSRLVEGDVRNTIALDEAVAGQDMVYANLTGDDLDEQANAVVAAMEHAGVRRLIFILSLGVHHEVPGAFGKWN